MTWNEYKNIQEIIMAMEDKIKELMALRQQAKLGGGEKRIASQHKKGQTYWQGKTRTFA